MIHIAIIGSGPSGCYIADMLAKKLPDSHVDLFERLPTPFGLVRAGVAPDHQHTKNITRQFERTLSRENVRFVGNVHIGTDLSYAELKEHYHIIVFASGAPIDRKLGIPGESLDGVYGSGEFSRWYNGHPDNADLNPLISENIAVIGNGNVALDILRVLSKEKELLLKSDISQTALDKISNANIKNIYIIGRRGAADANFTPMELQEVMSQPNLTFHIDTSDIPESPPEHIPEERLRNTAKNLEILHNTKTQASAPNGGIIHIHFLFNRPISTITSDTSRVSNIELTVNNATSSLATSSKNLLPLNVGTVISAIGYVSAPVPNVPFNNNSGIFEHHNSLIEPGVYAVGWCKRGANGVIPSNRVDATTLSKDIIADLENTVPLPHKEGFSCISTLFNERNIKPVSYNDWQVINKAEIDRATTGKPREKITTVSKMLNLLN
ncbi:NAD(P)-binding protein [Neptunomonas japonica]|uniref:NAD(P)-binding protein n=1 Tax=Neptunomonas japonica TaxID=417574 RepID=UPI000400EC73|nr:NAD(P)-binding protein [Neptunomonas japonica]